MQNTKTISCNNPKEISNYIETLTKSLRKQNVMVKMESIKNKLTKHSNCPKLSKKFNSLDKLIT